MLEHEEELENIKERNQRIAQIEVCFCNLFEGSKTGQITVNMSI